MSIFFAENSDNAVALMPICTADFAHWLTNASASERNWITAVNFTAQSETHCMIPGEHGKVVKVLIGLRDAQDFWSFGQLASQLPAGQYQLITSDPACNFSLIALAWGLGAYRFSHYKKTTRSIAQLVVPAHEQIAQLTQQIAAIYWVRDLINMPAADLGPAELATVTQQLALQYDAEFTQIVGTDLLEKNYPAIYAVGAGSPRLPRLLDLRWGQADAPKITLVGKGVCFDTGGLNLKTTAGMALMKKDMAGAAHVLGLASMIMAANLPVCLRVLIPAVENSISGSAYRPGDVLATRQGITVEVTDTDSEGRLVLCDALAEAVSENPALLIDMATLTGAARVAVGTDVGAMFANNQQVADAVLAAATITQDPIWPLPLYRPYRKLLDSSIADIANSSKSAYAGATVAALFLKEFVPDTITWLHFDIMAWNLSARPGRPEGGEAMVIRALFHYLQAEYSQAN